MDKVSVIVPIYNREKYLCQCVESILKSSYQNLEVILVDDGSTDNSLEICKSFSKIDARVKVIHKKNEGAGFARNAALDIASGDYIFFVDSDDYISNNAIEICVDGIKKSNCDISIVNFRCVDECDQYSNVNIESNIFIDFEMWTQFDFWEHYYSGDLVWCVLPGGKLFNKSIFKGIRYKQMSYEDEMILPDLINKQTRIAVCNSRLYFYRVHSSNTMGIHSGARYLNKIMSFEYRVKKFAEENNPHLGESIIWLMDSICYLRQYKEEIGSDKLREKYIASKSLVTYCILNNRVTPNIKKRIKCFKSSLRKYENLYLSKNGSGINRICKKMNMLRLKIKKYFQVKRVIRLSSSFLENGCYKLNGNCLKKEDNNRKSLNVFAVSSTNKVNKLYSSLCFKVTKYKTIVITDNLTYYFYRNKKRFIYAKNNIVSFYNDLPYPSITFGFDEKKWLCTAETLSGIKYKRHERFSEIVSLLFDKINLKSCIKRTMTIGNKKFEIPFYVQHGDFKDSNIIWTSNNEFKLIDLESINMFPLFFDLLFYVLISSTKNFQKVLFDKKIILKIKNAVDTGINVTFKYDDQYIDFALSIYLTYLLVLYKKEHTSSFFSYYLFWVPNILESKHQLDMVNSIINKELVYDAFFRKATNYELQNC